jgi:hypothetical protein
LRKDFKNSWEWQALVNQPAAKTQKGIARKRYSLDKTLTGQRPTSQTLRS